MQAEALAPSDLARIITDAIDTMWDRSAADALAAQETDDRLDR